MEFIRHLEATTNTVANFEFTVIPQNYTDLYLVMSIDGDRTPAVGDNILMQFNSSTANFTSRYLYGAGSGSPVGANATNLLVGAASGAATANTFANSDLYICNYTSSAAKNFYSHAALENNATEAYRVFTSGFWNSSDAINTIKIYLQFGTYFSQYSSATLYGITAGSDGTTTVS